MAIDFPSSPTVNQLFGADDKLWQWDGVAWESIPGPSHGISGVDTITIAQSQVDGLNTSLSNKASTTHASTHASGGSDVVTLAQSQVTNLTTDLSGKASTTHAASHASGGSDAITISASQVTGTAIINGDTHLITFCTSSTRPSPETDGQIIYETDTQKYYGWNGTIWSVIGGSGDGGSGDGDYTQAFFMGGI
jgi:hypothetical protein